MSVVAQTIGAQLAHNAKYLADEIWLISPESGLTINWAQAQSNAQEIARSLIAQGITPGESVAIAAPNSIGATLTFLGVILAGGRATPMNLVAGAKTMAYVLNHSKTRLVIVDNEVSTSIEEAIAATKRDIHTARLDNELGPIFNPSTSTPLPILANTDPALLMYTSGTTGNPKGVLLSHNNLLNAGQNVATAHSLSTNDRGLCVLPTYHINGLCVSVMGSIVSGSTLVMPRRFSKTQFWKQVVNYDCTWFSAVPTLFSYILNDDNSPDLSNTRLRFARSASAPLPPETHRKFENRFGIPIIETMGLTETGAQILSNPLPPAERKIGSPGQPMGNEVKIVDPESFADLPQGTEGEIVVRGQNVMLGYLDQPDETAKTITTDGWLRTGDLGKMDSDGFIFVTGRIKELIIKGGENIAPREIDEVLLEHDSVLEAAAFARPCDDYGQRIEACVRLKEGFSVTQEDLLRHCRERLGAFKSPDHIYVLDDLPKGPSGKVQRLRLAGMVT